VVFYHQGLTYQFSFLGIPVSNLPTPAMLMEPPWERALPILGVVVSLTFAFGFFRILSGTILFLLYCLYAVPWEAGCWGPLLPPLLACAILACVRTVPSIWIQRILKAIAFLGIGWIAWKQVSSPPWLDHSLIHRYVSFSPIAHLFPVPGVFAPLLAILGGYAFLLQLAAPLALLSAPFSRYWAALLFVLSGFLTLLMPLSFWNAAVMIALLPVLPEACFTFKVHSWKKYFIELEIPMRKVCFFLLMGIMLSTVFDRNIAEQFDVFDKIGSGTLEKTYEIATDPFVKTGNLILFNSIWKMYSPTWRKVVWIEWYLKKPDGTVEEWPEENFSPDYRMRRRSWLEALWTDFKKEKVFVGMLSRIGDRAAYARYLCHVVVERTGVKPASVQSVINSFGIRGPDATWSIFEQNAENIERDPEVTCD
jgi:hypothetical protein